MVKKAASRIYLALIFLFLYLPILVLIVLSFNNSKSRVVWGGFTLKWYAECFKNETITNAFVTTIQITLTAAIISTLLGTLAAIGISAMKKKNKAIMLGATNIPLLNADIVTGIAMMLLFVKFMNLGFVTVLIAHITFDIPYVILNVLPKLNQANRYTYEAALDLGATYGGVCQMMENEALQVIQKMNVKINGTEDEVKKFHEAMEVAKRALKKGIEVHPLGALHDVKKGTLYTCSNCGTRLGWGPNAARLANYCHGCGQKIDWKGTPRE